MTRFFCTIDEETRVFLEKAYETYHLSARSYEKILRVARTISDLEGEAQIGIHHVTEALCYRIPEMNYGGVTWN